MANWYSTENRLGVTSLMGVDSVNVDNTTVNNRYPVGMIVRGQETTLGLAGEFIYLQGNASLSAAGLLVSYNATTGATVVLPSTANLDTPVAVSMAVNASASNYSWFQIAGVATVLKTAVQITPQSKVYISGTAGRVFATSTSGREILGAKFANLTTVTSTTSTMQLLINRPFAQGQIT